MTVPGFGRANGSADISWGDQQAAAVFTFDLDAEQLWRAAADRNPGFERFGYKGAFGTKIGVPRVLEVFDKHDCRCTFFVPGTVAEAWPETVQRIHEAGHEIAHHTYSHTHPSQLSPEEEETQFKRTIDVFEDLIGTTPVGYRGGHSERTLSLLESVGMEYDSSLQDADVPYVMSGTDVVEVPNSLVLDDFPYWGFNMKPAFGFQSGISPTESVFDTWRAEFEGLRDRGRLFVLTMHPQVIGRAGRIDALDRLVERVAETDTWITTCAEISRHVTNSDS